MITLALIGFGRWGQNIFRTLEGIPRCMVKYVADERRTSTRGLPKGTTHTSDWHTLLRRSDLDGVLIATPASTHAAIARPFIARGIPTFIEKPLTTSLRDALALERLATRTGAPVMVGHVHLYHPAYQVVRRYARRAGRTRFILAEGMNQGPLRHDVSCLWDWAPHDLALALDLLPSPPVAVRAWGEALLRPRTPLYDVAFLEVRFRNGVRLFGTYSWLAPAKRKRLTIVGARDTIVFDDTAEQKVTRYAGRGPAARAGRAFLRDEVVSHPPYAPTPPLRAELAAFLRMVRTRRPPVTNLQQGVEVVRLLDVADRSIARGGRWVNVR